MLIHEFDELLEAQPFQPFRIITADGRSLRVPSREFAWHAPASRIIWVASRRGDERVHMIDLQLVTQFVVAAGDGRGKRRRTK
jgi:hypothetical protein